MRQKPHDYFESLLEETHNRILLIHEAMQTLVYYPENNCTNVRIAEQV